MNHQMLLVSVLVKIALLAPKALCRVVIGMAVMPVVQILALPPSTVMEAELRKCQNVATNIIKLIQTGLCSSKPIEVGAVNETHNYNQPFHVLQNYNSERLHCVE